jgi:MoxR-like ATPase
MQEQRVTVVGKTFSLQAPFLVLATQNPVEQEGTYPLPEAQLDRFMSLIELDYPSEQEEIEIAKTTTGGELPELKALMHADEILQHQGLVRRVPVPDAPARAQAHRAPRQRRDALRLGHADAARRPVLGRPQRRRKTG